MAFVTVDEAIRESRSVWSNRNGAETELRKSAAAAVDTRFDIFMSHSYEDAEVIEGVKLLIERREGLSVYVDWIEDAQLDRSQVTSDTARMLRQRMEHCRFLLYVSSKASPNSKWMPWELGYFDGLKNGRVGILPIVQSAGNSFAGQEYLGIYPPYQTLGFTKYGDRLGHLVNSGQGRLLKSDVRRSL